MRECHLLPFHRPDGDVSSGSSSQMGTPLLHHVVDPCLPLPHLFPQHFIHQWVDLFLSGQHKSPIIARRCFSGLMLHLWWVFWDEKLTTEQCRHSSHLPSCVVDSFRNSQDSWFMQGIRKTFKSNRLYLVLPLHPTLTPATPTHLLLGLFPGKVHPHQQHRFHQHNPIALPGLLLHVLHCYSLVPHQDQQIRRKWRLTHLKGCHQAHRWERTHQQNWLESDVQPGHQFELNQGVNPLWWR